jgi:chromosome segregation ATPase
MRQEQLKEQITQLQKENLNVEGELNKLHNDRAQSIKELEMLEKNLGFKNRRIDEIKRDVFQMTIELNKLNAEQQKKERQKAIAERLATQPIFDDIVEKELNLILCELREMNFNLGEEITFQDLWNKYQALVNDKAITRASVVRVEAMGQYKALLTNLIEKELDGGNIDLIEKRNLKQPIQNFLSNQFVKAELKL